MYYEFMKEKGINNVLWIPVYKLLGSGYKGIHT